MLRLFTRDTKWQILRLQERLKKYAMQRPLSIKRLTTFSCNIHHVSRIIRNLSQDFYH